VPHKESIVMNKLKVRQISSVLDSVGRYLVLCVCTDGSVWKLNGLYEGKPGWEPFTVPSRRKQKK